MKIIWLTNPKPEQINNLKNHEFNLIMVCSGFLCCWSDESEFCITPRHILFIPPGFPFKIQIDRRYYNKMVLISINMTLWYHPHYRLHGTAFAATLYSRLSVFKLKRTEFIYLSYLIRTLDFKLNTTTSETEFETGIIDFLLWKELQSISESKNTTSFTSSRKISVVAAFYHALTFSFKSEHAVQFYAARLCVTSDYLNKSVKELSGQTVRQHINGLLIQEAKWLLEDHRKNITEIAYELGFTSLAIFSKFFKKHTGCSPETYRNNMFKNGGYE